MRRAQHATSGGICVRQSLATKDRLVPDVLIRVRWSNHVPSLLVERGHGRTASEHWGHCACNSRYFLIFLPVHGVGVLQSRMLFMGPAMSLVWRIPGGCAKTRAWGPVLGGAILPESLCGASSHSNGVAKPNEHRPDGIAIISSSFSPAFATVHCQQWRAPMQAPSRKLCELAPARKGLMHTARWVPR